MEKYICQLLDDIAYATENVSWPFVQQEVDIHDWMPPDEEELNAPARDLEQWTGIFKEQLPPSEMLSNSQVHRLLVALKNMLDMYNCSFVLQTEVPIRIQYATIRDYFDQQVKVKRWHYGFFELCRPGTEHGKCTLKENCQCAFYSHLFADFIHDELSLEDERANALEIEISHLKSKYGSEWVKYYPYHLDAEYDEDNRDSFEYGFSEDDPDN
jgi:hypothetical protein